MRGICQSAAVGGGVGLARPAARLRLRPMTATDVPAVIAVTWAAFGIPADSPGLLATGVLIAAGLDVVADGAGAVTGTPGPLCPYIPSGPLARPGLRMHPAALRV